MADKRIDELPAGTTVGDTDKFLFEQGGTAKQISGAILREQIGSGSDAANVAITDAGGYYTSTNVEGALQELGAAIQALQGGGTT